MSTDAEWEKWGRENPYFGVITAEEYRREHLTEEARQAFFRGGRENLSDILTVCRKRVDPEFTPRRALEFGCGVGRLTIPLAQIAEEVVGLDISPSMLDEARKNLAEHGLENVQLLRSDDELSAVRGEFDFILSRIVFQHIPVDRGARIFARLLDHLTRGGLAAIQFKYDGPTPVPLVEARLLDLPGRVYRGLKRRLRDPARDPPSPRDPEMQMNRYDLNELLSILQSTGVSELHVVTENHGGEMIAGLFFRKP